MIFLIFMAVDLNFEFIFKESTIHGIRYFVDGENAFHRFVWFIIMGFSVGGLSHLVFTSYMSVQL